MTAGFIGINVTCIITSGFNMSLSAKSIQKFTESRGTLTLAVAFFSSAGVLLIDGIGGHIFKNDKRNPFWMCLGAEGFLIVLIICLACFK